MTTRTVSLEDSQPRGLRYRFRIARVELFLKLIDPPQGATILDLGGGMGAMSGLISARRPDLHITVADIEPTRFLARDLYGFREAALEPDAPLPFGDGEYDVVFCNSVIEHVTLPKERCLTEVIAERDWRAASLEHQRRFAAEIARVGRRFFVQTPHRAFPIDAHIWLPFTGWLSHEATRRLVRFTDRWWIKKCGVADWHLLDANDMADLFPGSTITVERFLGLPKSIVAWR